MKQVVQKGDLSRGGGSNSYRTEQQRPQKDRDRDAGSTGTTMNCGWESGCDGDRDKRGEESSGGRTPNGHVASAATASTTGHRRPQRPPWGANDGERTRATGHPTTEGRNAQTARKRRPERRRGHTVHERGVHGVRCRPPRGSGAASTDRRRTGSGCHGRRPVTARCRWGCPVASGELTSWPIVACAEPLEETRTN